jgi:thioester reductase-like protein
MHVFLTGATGLVGGALAGALLDARHRVTALVRGEGRDVLDMDGRDRIGEIAVVQGDVAQPGFGMAEPHTGVDLLIHCAATVDFAASDAVHEAVNVGGTAHAIALSRAWNCPLLHVSTAYVCGRADGVIGEEPADPLASFTNGYEASKARAEALVEAARRDGLVAAIARPAIIVGRLSDGAIARIDGFHHLFRLFGSPLLGDRADLSRHRRAHGDGREHGRVRRRAGASGRGRAIRDGGHAADRRGLSGHRSSADDRPCHL